MAKDAWLRVRLDAELSQLLDAQAAEMQRTRSDTVRLILRAALAANDAQRRASAALRSSPGEVSHPAVGTTQPSEVRPDSAASAEVARAAASPGMHSYEPLPSGKCRICGLGRRTGRHD